MANEKRLIDANALMDAFRRVIAERHDRERCVSEENCNTCERECLWRRVVKKAPTVDAVEVVRCKDCKHRGDDAHCPMCFEEMSEYDDGDGYMEVDYIPHDRTTDDGFCDRGERRTDNADNQ